MTKKSEGANEDKMIESKSKSVSGKSQKQKNPVEKEVKPVGKEVKSLIQESGTDSVYDADSLPGSLNSDDFDELHDHEGSIDDKSEQIDGDNNEEGGSDECSKKEKQDKLDSFLATMDDSTNRRKKYDDEEVELAKEESKIKGEAPHTEFDSYPPYIDWFKWNDAIHQFSSTAQEHKQRFIPSKWEAKMVVKYVRAIRKGLINFDKPEEEPKLKLPGHKESYNTPLEYIPTEDEEERPKFRWVHAFCCGLFG